MNKRIIYKNDTGGVAVIIPWLGSGLTVEEIAAKDVPAGKPYRIVDAADIPTDRTNRDAWTVEIADLTDGAGADYGLGSDNEVVGWNEDGTPILRGEE
jgi:hypothetical protein